MAPTELTHPTWSGSSWHQQVHLSSPVVFTSPFWYRWQGAEAGASTQAEPTLESSTLMLRMQLYDHSDGYSLTVLFFILTHFIPFIVCLNFLPPSLSSPSIPSSSLSPLPPPDLSPCLLPSHFHECLSR